MHNVRFGTASEFVSMSLPHELAAQGWVQGEVQLSVRGFRGAIKPFFEKVDLEQFLRQLAAMHATLTGAAEFQPREEQFTLSLKVDARGHVLVSGSAWSQARHGNHLEFELELDQSFLREPIDQLREALHAGGQAA